MPGSLLQVCKLLRAGAVAAALAIVAGAPGALAQDADLTVSKSGPATAAAGTNVTYTIMVTNLGPDAATNPTMSDPIPAGMTFVSVSAPGGWTCTTPAVGAGGTISCDTAVLGSGDSASFSVSLAIPGGTAAGTFFTNIATGTTTAFDPNEENNSGVASTSVAGGTSADLVVLKSGPGSAAADTDVTYTITVTNAGPDPALAAQMSDTLPGTMTFVSVSAPAGWSCTTPAVGAGGTVTCTNPSVAAGTSGAFTLVGHIPAGTGSGTSFDNTAIVSTSTNDPSPENDASTVSTTVSSVDLSIAKSGPATAAHGQNITYTITVGNAGPDSATDVTWADNLVNLTFVSITQNTGPTALCTAPGVGASGTVSCSTGLLGAGQSQQFTLVVNSGSDPAPSRTNTATVGSGSADTNSADNTSSATTTLTAAADLALTKGGPTGVPQGGQATYAIMVSHAGGSTATAVTMTDTMGAGLTFASLAAPAGWACTTPAVGGTGAITCTKPSFAFGEAGNFTLVANVVAALGATVSNTASVATATPDPNGANNAQTTNAIVANGPDLGITKTHSGTPQRGQAAFAYTITVSNGGNGASSGTVTVTDTLPAGMTATAMSGAGWACSLGATPTCTRSDALAVGASFPPITLTVRVATDAPANVTNVATVSGGGDINTANNTANDPATLAGGPTAASFSVSMRAGTTKTVDVTAGATGGPFTGGTIVSVTPAGAGTAAIAPSGGAVLLSFTPAATFTGVAVVTFTLSTAGATTAPATVTFTVVPRSDPSKDPEVIGLVNAQVAAADRFANAQIANFNQRLESLHEDGYGDDRQGIAFGQQEQPSANAYVADAYGHLPGATAYLEGTPRGGSAGKDLFDRMMASADPSRARPRDSGRRPGPRRPLSVWSSGYINFGSANQTVSGSGFDFTTSGVSVGMDYRFSPTFTAGVGVGYGRDRSRIGNNGTESIAQTFSVTVYESYRPFKGWFFDGLIGFGTLDFESRRFVTDTGGYASGQRGGSQWFTSFTAGYEHRHNGLLLSPYVRINAIWSTLAAFTETGDPTGSLTFSQQDVSTVAGVLGLRGKYDILTDWGVVSPRVRVEYNRSFQDGGALALNYADWIGGPTYTMPAWDMSRGFLTLGLGTDVRIRNGMFVNFDYQTLFNASDARSHRFVLKAGTRF